MNRKLISLAVAMALAAGVKPALAEWQCLSAGAKVPTATRAASDYLERAERAYPTQVLGVLRAGDRVYLVNARDDGWTERVRLGLLELRLPEPDITAARRFQAALSGGPTPETSGIPAGEYVCLAQERAARQGLTIRGEAVHLAAGKSVRLVDPIELGIVVEVKAASDRPLDLREIFAASARAGIYAGLFRGRAQSGPVVAARPPESAVTFPVGPIERPNGEVVILARAPAGGRLDDSIAAIGAVSVPSVPAPAAVVVAPAPPVVEQPSARVATADVPAAPPPVKPLPQETAAAVVVAVAEPAPVVAPAAPERPVVLALTPLVAAPLPVKPLPQETPAAVVAVAEPAPVAAPAVPERPVVLAAPAPPVAEPTPTRVAMADVTVSPPPAKPMPRETPPAVILAAAVSVAAPGAQRRPTAEQSYEDYAKTMKELMALRRSGAVRSISEMTYVHPAVEDLRARR